MRRMLQRLGASNAADRLLKRTSQGWIFRAPTPWILGPHPHYLVSEAQKAKIEIVVGASTVGNLLLSAAVFVLLWAPALSLDASIQIFALCCLIAIAQNLYHCCAFRDLLKNSSRTPEQITFAQRNEALLAAYSVAHLMFLLMLFLVLFLGVSSLLVYQALVGTVDLFFWVSAIALGGVTIYCGALLRLKRRSLGRI
jgi:hypothetical protein